MFRSRHLADTAISHALEGILSCQICRLGGSEKIISYGYDAKDTLLRHLKCSDATEDVLARRSGLLDFTNRRLVR